MSASPLYKSAAGEETVMAIYDRLLAHWPMSHEEVYLPTRHGDTFLIASGEARAPALVLLHGANSNALAWMGDVACYARSFRVYAVDIIGEPGRSAPSRPALVGPAYAEWLEDLLDGLHVKKASLIGISQGGWTALRFATLNPERVQSLVLLAPGGVAPARPSFLLRAIPLSMLGRWGAERITRIVAGDQHMHEEAVAFMNAIMTHFKARITAQPMFTDDELSRLTMPVQLIAGARDALIPTEKVLPRLQGLLPHLDASILPQAGHAVHNTAELVMPFLTRASGIAEGARSTSGSGPVSRQGDNDD